LQWFDFSAGKGLSGKKNGFMLDCGRGM